MEDDVNSVAAVRDDLDNYGGHLPVVIEAKSGNVYHLGSIVTRDYGDGVVVVIETGDRYGE